MHTLTIENNDTGNCYFNGFYILPLSIASNYCKKLQLDINNFTVSENKIQIPLNLLSFFIIGNITNKSNLWYESSVITIDVISGKGMVGYKLQFPWTNKSSLTDSEKTLRSNFTQIYNTDISSNTGSKTEIEDITCDNNNLIIEFSNLDTDYTMINIS